MSGDGETPLHTACQRGNLEAVKFLIANGAAVNAKRPGYGPPLYEAGRFLHPSVVAALLEAGADPRIKHDFHNQTPLDGGYAGMNRAFSEAELNRGWGRDKERALEDVVLLLEKAEERSANERD